VGSVVVENESDSKWFCPVSAIEDDDSSVQV